MDVCCEIDLLQSFMVKILDYWFSYEVNVLILGFLYTSFLRLEVKDLGEIFFLANEVDVSLDKYLESH